MTDYYFDIETNPKGERPDFKGDDILTIQYQQIDTRTGEKKDELVILKSWESSEKDILEKFYHIFNPEKPWEFVPVGFNLVFDYFSLLYRWREIGINIKPKSIFSDRPNIDLKPIVVMCNSGSFKGANLGRFIGKKDSGLKVSEWCKEGDYSSVQEYIEDEVDRFIKFYQFLVNRMPEVWQEFAKANGISQDN